MKASVDEKLFSKVCSALINSDARSAIKYVAYNIVVRATWHNKPSGRHTRETMVVSYGAPNYRERKFIKACKKANEPFPISRIQFRFWPKKK